MGKLAKFIIKEIPYVNLESDEEASDTQAPPGSPTLPVAPASAATAPPTAPVAPTGSPAHSAADVPTAPISGHTPSQTISPARSDSSSSHSRVRYPYVSDDDSYTLRYGRAGAAPTHPPAAPTARPTRGRATARISAGRRPTHQLARRDFPAQMYEQGESSRQANQGPRPAAAPGSHLQTPSPYYHPAPPPPQPTVHPEVRGRLDSLCSGLKSMSDRVCEMDLSFMCWRDILDTRTSETNGTIRDHRADTVRQLARVTRLIYAIGGIAVLAVIISALSYLYPRY